MRLVVLGGKIEHADQSMTNARGTQPEHKAHSEAVPKGPNIFLTPNF